MVAVVQMVILVKASSKLLTFCNEKENQELTLAKPVTRWIDHDQYFYKLKIADTIIIENM